MRSAMRSVGEKRSPKWDKVEEDFKAAHPKCECCGTKQRLQVHHIKPFHVEPSLELDETNLITLCMSDNECHLRVGHGGDFKSYNPNVVQDIQEVHAGNYTLLTVAEKAKANKVPEEVTPVTPLEQTATSPEQAVTTLTPSEQITVPIVVPEVPAAPVSGKVDK